MFGSNDVLIMDSPHIVIFRNQHFSYNKLSKDRLIIDLLINESLKRVNISLIKMKEKTKKSKASLIN